MPWWNGKQQPKAEPSPVRWSQAKEITPAEAARGQPTGWYIFRDGNTWYGLRPSGGGTEQSQAFQDLPSLEAWLGVPLPWNLASHRSGLDTLVGQTVQQRPVPSPAPDMIPEPEPTEDIPHLPPDANTAAVETPPSTSEETREQPKASWSRRPQTGRKRGIEFHFFLSTEEALRFHRRVQRTGLTQSEFLRRAALTGRIVVEDYSEQNVAIQDTLSAIQAELGRQGGMLKMVVKPNQGQRELAPEEWQELVQAIRYLERTKKMLGDLKEKLDHGHH